jgi:hypothetical protein
MDDVVYIVELPMVSDDSHCIISSYRMVMKLVQASDEKPMQEGTLSQVSPGPQ